MEDRVVQRGSIVAFGVISVGHRTAFWEWLAGGGFHHVWTGSPSTDIMLKLKLVLVDVIFFDHTNPGPRHLVWLAAGVWAVLWCRGPSAATVPSRWTPRDVTFFHLALGGVTDGQF